MARKNATQCNASSAPVARAATRSGRGAARSPASGSSSASAMLPPSPGRTRCSPPAAPAICRTGPRIRTTVPRHAARKSARARVDAGARKRCSSSAIVPSPARTAPSYNRRLPRAIAATRTSRAPRRKPMPKDLPAKKVLDAVRNAAGNRVKVAVSDIDGVLRGKYLHKDKFFSAVEGGFGFCDVVFGWDMNDQCYDNTTLTGWHKGFPDALARIDLGTHRAVPWDDGVPFFLGEFVVHAAAGKSRTRSARASCSSACSRARKSSASTRDVRHGVRMVQFRRDAAIVGGEGLRAAGADHAGHVRLLAAARGRNREFFKALMDEMGDFGVPIEGLAYRNRPRRLRGRHPVLRGARAADRAILFKTGAKEIGARFGIMPSFMAKWSAQLPGLQRAHPPEPFRRQEEPVPRRRQPHRMSTLFESYLAGPARLACPSSRRCSGPRSTATSAWSTASGRRPSRPGASTTAPRASASSPAARSRRGWRRAARRRHQPLPRGRGLHRRRPVRRREEPAAHGRRRSTAPTSAPRTCRARRAR